VSKTITIKGRIDVRNGIDDAESESIIYISDVPDEPLLERIQSIKGIYEKKVSFRWWTSTEEASVDKVKEEFIKKVLGFASVSFGAVYSDLTGFLWFNNDMKIGGHDVAAEIASETGRWIVLEIEVHS